MLLQFKFNTVIIVECSMCELHVPLTGRFGPIPIRTLGRFGPIPFRSGCFSLCLFGPISGWVVSAQFWWFVLAYFILYSFLDVKSFSV